MAYNVNFLKGTAQSFEDLAVKSKNTFYYIDEKDLYIGDIKLTNGADLDAAVLDIAKNKGDIEIIQAQLEDLTGTGGGDNSSLTELISNLSNRLTLAEAQITSEITRAEEAEAELATNISNANTEISQLSQLVNENETDIEGKVATLSDKVDANTQSLSSTSGLVQSLAITLQEQGSTISTIQGDISELEGLVDTLVGADSSKSVRTIAIEVLAEQLLADGLTENFATLQELAAWLADHPEEAAEMNAAIQANATAIETLQTNVNTQGVTIKGLQDQLAAFNAADTGVLALSKKYTDEKVQEVNLELTEFKNDNTAVIQELNTVISNNTNSLAQAQAKLQELQASFNGLGSAAYKNVEDFDAAGSAAAALDAAKSYTDAEIDKVTLKWGEIEN